MYNIYIYMYNIYIYIYIYKTLLRHLKKNKTKGKMELPRNL